MEEHLWINFLYKNFKKGDKFVVKKRKTYYFISLKFSMKKVLSYIVIFNILFLNLSFFTFQTVKASTPVFSSENYFVVTAYYSPLPNQKYYFKGSYEADMKLNGRWVAWASWKPVFAWMFAAPKRYSFWTKIYLEWIWVWEVADRWWAIVSTDPSESRWYQYDRIDIWMWHGEEWLARALAFWKKTIKWYVIADSSTEVSINLNSLPSPNSILAKYEVNPTENTKVVNNSTTTVSQVTVTKIPDIIGKLQVNPKTPKEEDVKKLQTLFTEMWMYKWKIDGKYDSIKDTFIAYQAYRWIITSKNSAEAWYFWDKTITQLNKDYALVLEKNWDKIEQTKKIEAQLASIKKSVDSRVETHISSIWTPKVWDVGENVRNLQKTLKTLWYFKVADTAIFWETTKNSLIKYQMDKWIIKSKEEDGAWLFWPKTKESLKSELAIILETQLLKEKDLLSYKK